MRFKLVENVLLEDTKEDNDLDFTTIFSAFKEVPEEVWSAYSKGDHSFKVINGQGYDVMSIKGESNKLAMPRPKDENEANTWKSNPKRMPASYIIDETGRSFQIVDGEQYIDMLTSAGANTIQAEKSGAIIATKAKAGDEVITYTDDGNREAPEIASEGQWKFTRADLNTHKPVVDKNGHTNSWFADESVLKKKYDFNNMEPNGFVRPKGGVQVFMQIDRDVCFMKPWGANGAIVPQTIRAGGFVNATSPKDAYGIAANEFRETYATIKESLNPLRRRATLYTERDMKFNLIENILNEDIEGMKKYYPNISDDDFMSYIKLDPTYKGGKNAGTYGKWILGLADKGKLTNIGHVKDLLTRFEDNKKNLVNKDIMKYKSLEDVDAMLNDESSYKEQSHRQIVRQNQKNRRNVDLDSEAELVYEDSDWEIWVPQTYAASCKLGQGTSWCTASTESDYYYNEYLNYGGEYYILINKTNPREKYQFHFETNQFMDREDEPVSLSEFYNEYPNVIKFFCELGKLKVPDLVWWDSHTMSDWCDDFAKHTPEVAAVFLHLLQITEDYTVRKGTPERIDREIEKYVDSILNEYNFSAESLGTDLCDYLVRASKRGLTHEDLNYLDPDELLDVLMGYPLVWPAIQGHLYGVIWGCMRDEIRAQLHGRRIQDTFYKIDMESGSIDYEGTTVEDLMQTYSIMNRFKEDWDQWDDEDILQIMMLCTVEDMTSDGTWHENWKSQVIRKMPDALKTVGEIVKKY